MTGRQEAGASSAGGPSSRRGATSGPTVRSLLDVDELRLVLRAGRAAIDAEVGWVAVSELADPTPYLEGGELLLTTGLRIGDDEWGAFVVRLAAAEVSGLGIGVGLTHDRVPQALVEAAESAGLPLLEVPEPTPFIAVSRVVSRFLAAAEYEAVTRTVENQRDLTTVALGPEGATAVVSRLALALTADVVLLDASGRLMHAAPSTASDLADALAGEVDAMRGRGPRTSARIELDARSVVVQPLAPAGRVRGFLAVARAEPLSTADLSLANVGVALVSLALERSVGADDARRELRSAVLALLVDGVPPDRLPLEPLGWAPLSEGPVRVLVAGGTDDDLVTVLEQVEDTASSTWWRGAAVVAGRVVVLQPADAPVVPPTTDTTKHLSWGVSDPVAVGQVADGVRQASRARAAAAAGGVRAFDDLARDGLVGLVDPDAGRGFADSLLGPLEARERGDLVASVRAWLAHNGQWDAAAASLGVHRHTVRYRMRRVEELLGRPLDDPGLRAELWVALAIRDRDTGIA
jgi:purine catabolism regulator